MIWRRSHQETGGMERPGLIRTFLLILKLWCALPMPACPLADMQAACLLMCLKPMWSGSRKRGIPRENSEPTWQPCTKSKPMAWKPCYDPSSAFHPDQRLATRWAWIGRRCTMGMRSPVRGATPVPLERTRYHWRNPGVNTGRHLSDIWSKRTSYTILFLQFWY
mgnify:CR=1 FL=1